MFKHLIFNIIILFTMPLLSVAQNNNTVIIGGSQYENGQTINGIPMSQDIGGVTFQNVDISDNETNCLQFRAYNYNPFPVTVIVKFDVRCKLDNEFTDWETCTKTIVLQAAVNGKPTSTKLYDCGVSKNRYCNLYTKNVRSITRKLGGQN